MKKFFRVVFLIITIPVAIAYLFSCLTPYISPAHFWPFTFLALGFPIIAVILICTIIIWFLVRRRVAVILLILLLLGYKNLFSTWAVSVPHTFNYDKDTSALRILDWNVRYFDNNERAADTPNSVRQQMISYIRKVNPDVLLFQDYSDYVGPLYVSNFKTMTDSLGFKYSYASRDSTTHLGSADYITGCAIYSKLPIIDSKTITYESIGEPEGIYYADIVFKNRKIRFYTTHLVSMQIRPHPGISNEQGEQKYDSAYRYGKKVTKTIKRYDQIHVKQAEFVKSIISQSPYPSIITGDFNSVPSSYVYHTIRGNKQDAFINKGFGLGHTYYALTKTLRIDYILVDPALKISQVTTPALYLSDHFPVVTDVRWTNR
jgi:endonuclease/exonuclease/phosphatase family metal-dependent hydrolase